ncbi:GNAT family N-acetyltransferase [Actinoallomurus acaciae]|uniref:GNAT family N-acetyltransferase n=1 Tax=Actinoallomurus acaciae TaxID=502577 RepID=A0ABV5Y6Z5_9ACTN
MLELIGHDGLTGGRRLPRRHRAGKRDEPRRSGGQDGGCWSLNLTVLHAGDVVGQQSIGARDLTALRQVQTGSWLGQRYQRQGIGTEMRAAVLHLAFTGLGAEEAVSSAFATNPASQAVSRKLGYQPDGLDRRLVRGAMVIDCRMRLTRAAWERHRTIPVSIDGLAPCLPMFGIDAA